MAQVLAPNPEGTAVSGPRRQEPDNPLKDGGAVLVGSPPIYRGHVALKVGIYS